jgi:hypothetical protein
MVPTHPVAPASRRLSSPAAPLTQEL